MLLIFLILFTKVIADSEEDKYVDLLPDEEKQQFIEKVARRILKDVESKENGKPVSGELSDELLQKHNEYVKSILKQESDNIRRAKTEVAKDKEEKPPASEENLEIKHLESEKIADDPDLDQVDLTLRNDRRGDNFPPDKSADYIKVEIVTENAPIIKRSVRNESDEDEDSDSKDSTINASENHELKTELSAKRESNTERPIKVAPLTKTTQNITSTSFGTVLIKTNNMGQKLSNYENESSTSKEIIKHNVSTTNESQQGVYIKNGTEHIKTTTTGSVNKNTRSEPSKSGESSETDGQDIQVRIVPKTRKANFDSISNETMDITTASVSPNSGAEYFGIKSIENKSDEFKSITSSDIEEFTTVTYPTDLTTTETEATTKTEATTENINKIIEKYNNVTKYSSANNMEKGQNTTEILTENTLTSTMTDEGTTNFVIDTTTYKSSTETLSTPVYLDYSTNNTEYTTENIYKPVATTEGMRIVVEDFKSARSGETIIKSPTDQKQIIHRAVESDESTTIVTTSEINKEELTTTQRNKPQIQEINVKKPTKTSKTVKENTKKQATKAKQVKNTKVSESADKNFIELEKVYYKQKSKSKPKGKEYVVYEIPANESPFIRDKDPTSEQPYYVPIYNYSPNNAYFNPQNRLGPNANADSNEQVSTNLELIEDENIINKEEGTEEDIRNPDVGYSDSAVNNQRKKFATKERKDSFHKMPQTNYSPVKQNGNGKVNPEYYLDSDYYFGKLRKYLERRVNHNTEGLFPNSDEIEHPAHSIQEMNLKDHVRAVRNILFQQKFFGPVLSSEMDSETDVKLNANNDNLPKNSNYLVRNGLYDSNNNNNIAIDYYFGRMKSAATTPKSTNVKNDQIFKKVGYLTNRNDTKELYVIDKFFKDNVVKYMQKLNSDVNGFIKADLKPVASFSPHKPLVTKINFTPHPPSIINAAHRPAHAKPYPAPQPTPHSLWQTPKQFKKPLDKTNKIKSDLEVQRYRNEEKKRNAFLSKPPLKKADNIPGYKDLFLDIEELNMKLHRRYEDVKVTVYLDVLRDMLSTDNKALIQYDWLGTTVDIQSALQKLFELVALARDEEEIHPADLEILKYVVFLHKLSGEIAEANDFGAQLRKKMALPRNKKKKEKHRLLKEKGLLNRVWLYLRKPVPEVNEDGALKNLKKFLINVEDSLYDLHEAIKNVAKVTKYKNQHWYHNLKDLYLDTGEKHLLELLLHMSVSRLYGLIEESAKNGLEDDYVRYMKRNKKEAKRTLEELLFVTQILDEINKNVE